MTQFIFYFYRIIPRTTEPDYVAIIRDWGCYSQLGKKGGRQTLSLKKGCAGNVGIPIHEFMHAIGICRFKNLLMEKIGKKFNI